MLYLTKQFKFLSKFQSFWAIVLICNPSGSKVRHSRWIFLGLQIALQMKCNGQIAELNRSNEHVLAEALWTQFFLELLTSCTHHFNTEPRLFTTIWIFQCAWIAECKDVFLNRVKIEVFFSKYALAIDASWNFFQ